MQALGFNVKMAAAFVHYGVHAIGGPWEVFMGKINGNLKSLRCGAAVSSRATLKWCRLIVYRFHVRWFEWSRLYVSRYFLP